MAGAIGQQKKIKKWTTDEIGKIINYLEENPKIEHPTAQLYYKKFLEGVDINASWHLVKFKVRYLKTKLREAENWRITTGAGLLEIDEASNIKTVQEKLHKICPFYDRLNAIFNPSNKSAGLDAFDTANNAELVELVDNFEANDLKPEIGFAGTEQARSTSLPARLGKDSFPKKLKSSTCKDALFALAKMQEQRTYCMEKGLKLDEEHFSKEFDFQKEKFQAEMLFKEKELALKKLEIEQGSKERKHKLELEKEEEVAKMQEQRTYCMEKRLKLDEERFSKELDFQKEKFQATMLLKEKELALKKLEIELASKERQHKLELEKEERLARYELELKYIYNN